MPSRVIDYPLSTLIALSLHWLDLGQELNMTADRDLFHTPRTTGRIPLAEGKTIWQYNHAHDGALYWLDTAAVRERLKSKELHRMAGDLGIKKSEAQAHYAHAIRFDCEFPRLAFRPIASDTNERTLIFAILPPNCSFGHSMFAIWPKKYIWNETAENKTVNIESVSILRQLFALGIFNSLVVDWIARFMVQINVSKTYLMRLPIPQPENDAAILNNRAYRQLTKNALILTLVAIRRAATAPHAPAVDVPDLKNDPAAAAFVTALAPAMQALGVRWFDVLHIQTVAEATASVQQPALGDAAPAALPLLRFCTTNEPITSSY